jgi:5'-methylthioadenosine phosphorylase
MTKIGIIGGSGLDDPNLLHDARDVEVTTVYGSPSAPLKAGTIEGREVVLLARHGREHTIPPTSACGSLREEIDRGHLVILDQFIDFTRRRDVSFHETFAPHGAVHTGMAEPFDDGLRDLLNRACAKLGLAHHERGTVITIEGSRFSTRAESNMFRMWGADVINMSVAPECILANEAGLPYAAVAMSTDYDCWKTDEAPVTWEEILEVFKSNVEKVTSLLVETVRNID